MKLFRVTVQEGYGFHDPPTIHECGAQRSIVIQATSAEEAKYQIENGFLELEQWGGVVNIEELPQTADVRQVKNLLNYLLDLVETWAEDYYGENGMTDYDREEMIKQTIEGCPLGKG